MKTHIFTEYKYIWEFAIKAVYYLGIEQEEVNIIISVKNKLPDQAYGYCHGEDEDIEIELARRSYDNKLDRETILRTLAHEMVHAKQFIKGELKRARADTVLWKNKKYDWSEDDDDNPWEVEAYALENEVYEHCQ